MSRYVLITFRKNGWNYDRCSGHREDETEALFEVLSSKDREQIVLSLAGSLARGGLHETGSEYEPREHRILIDGFEADLRVDDPWVYCEDGEEEAYHNEAKAIFAEAESQVLAKIEAAKREAQEKAEREAERSRKLLRDQEVNRLARLTKERDELAARLGVAT